MMDPEFFEEANEDIGPMQMLGYVFGYLFVVAVAVGLALSC